MRFEFRPFEIVIQDDRYWISFLDISSDNFYALLHIEYDMGHWKFDFLFLRTLIFKIRDKIGW